MKGAGSMGFGGFFSGKFAESIDKAELAVYIMIL